MTRTSTILVFPGGIQEGIEYMLGASARGEKVVGASSLVGDPAQKNYTTWEYLPYINKPDFNEKFFACIQKHKVGHIYAPHPFVGRHLKELLKKNPEITLETISLKEKENNVHRDLMASVRREYRARLVVDVPGCKPLPSEVEMAAILRHATHIEGQSDNAKLWAMCDVARSAPKGDLVEIGSLYGRTAFVLAHLATKYQIGSLLCVDPWSPKEVVQKDVMDLVNEEMLTLNYDDMVESFTVNVLPYAHGHVNYIRARSDDGFVAFSRNKKITTPELGTVTYTGTLSLLHIDGNHDYPIVSKDIADWCPLVQPGGWIIIDDYVWAVGKGPQQAADEYIEKNRAHIECAFVTGSALFLRKK